MSYLNYQDRELPFAARYVADLVKYRHLCWSLAGADLRARFRRSRLGIIWAVIQPLAFSLMVALVWGQIFQSKTYWEFATYVFSGMLVWEFFNTTTQGSLDALINATGYLRQQRIPFLIFQLRGPLVAVVIFVAGFVGLEILLAALGTLPPIGWHLLLIPLALLLNFAVIVPISVLLSIAGTQFRDLKYITMLLMQALFFLTPVMLERRLLEEPHLRFLSYVNPAVPMINLFRDPALYGQSWQTTDVLTLLAWIVALSCAAGAVSTGFGRKVIFAL